MRIILLILSLAAIVFPSGYGVATITNPTSALNEFVFSVDLSLMPAEWWAQVTDTSGMKMRAYKSTGTRLPIDLVWIDTSAHTGCVKGMWTGTLASSGTQQVIVFPPDSGRSVTLPTNPYGKNSVYSNYIAYYPLDGNGNERSGNGYDMTVSGAIDTVGYNCRAYWFDGTDDYISETTNKIPASAFQSGFTFITMCKISNWNNGKIINKADGIVGENGFTLYPSSSSMYKVRSNISGTSITSTIDVTPDTYSQVVFTIDSAGSVVHYLNGSSAGTGTSPSPTTIISTNALIIGNSSSLDRPLSGTIDDVQIIRGVMSQDWQSESYLMESDQATFWGTWTYVKVPDITSLEPDSAAIGSQAYLKGIFLGLTFQPGDSLTISTAKAPITAVNDTAVFYTVPNVSEGFYGDTTIVCAAGICDTLVGDSIYFYRAPSSSNRRSHWSGWGWRWTW